MLCCFLVTLRIDYQYCNNMSRLDKKLEKISDADSLTSNSSFLIPQQDIQRTKKRKKNAFQSFLSKVELDSADRLPVKRKMSDHQMDQETLQVTSQCKICNKILKDKVKVCEFCKDTMCITHFRKARRHPTTNKFSRICDHCEDNKLMERHYQHLIIKEESILSEQAVVQEKYNRLKKQLEEKRNKLKQQREKRQELQRINKVNEPTISEDQITRLFKEVEAGMEECKYIQRRLTFLQSNLPHSEQQDYIILNKQRQKLTKELNKLRKQCQTCIKAKSDLQKQMYEDLYEWQLMLKYKISQDNSKNKKKQECVIY